MNERTSRPSILDSCGTEGGPHQWARTPVPDDTCLRCGVEYVACGIAWHEVAPTPTTSAGIVDRIPEVGRSPKWGAS